MESAAIAEFQQTWTSFSATWVHFQHSEAELLHFLLINFKEKYSSPFSEYQGFHLFFLRYFRKRYSTTTLPRRIATHTPLPDLGLVIWLDSLCSFSFSTSSSWSVSSPKHILVPFTPQFWRSSLAAILLWWRSWLREVGFKNFVDHFIIQKSRWVDRTW